MEQLLNTQAHFLDLGPKLGLPKPAEMWGHTSADRYPQAQLLLNFRLYFAVYVPINPTGM